MLLFPPGGPYRANYPTIVQSKTNRNANNCTFSANTTIGNLLLFLRTQRSGTGTCAAPNDGGTWTTLGSGQFQATSGSSEQLFAAYARIVDVAQTFYSTGGPSPTTAILHEVANHGGLGAITVPTPISDHASATAVDLGALGTIETGRLVFGLFGNGGDGAAETVTPGVWIRDYFADRDVDSGGTESISGAGAVPQTYYAHAVGAGIAMQARIDLSVAQKFGGLVVLLA